MKEEYLLLEIVILPDQRDSLVSILWDADTLGIQELDMGGELKIIAWFPKSRDKFSERIKSSADSEGIVLNRFRSEVQTYDSDEWLARFNQQFAGVELEGQVFIHPPWIKPSPDIPVNILLEPGHAFGTGTHESTQLALLAMIPALEVSSTFLDVGTGSGVLAIAAGKINPKLHISLCDIDDMAIESAVGSLHQNGIESFRAVTGGPELFLESRFQVVVANLTSPVLVSLEPVLSTLTDDYLILSGVTEEQQDTTLEPFLRRGFVLEAVESGGGWIASRLRKDL